MPISLTAKIVSFDQGVALKKSAAVSPSINSTVCLARPEQWPDLKSFAVIESERCLAGKTSLEQRFYISSLPPDAERLAPTKNKGDLRERRFIAATSDRYRKHLLGLA
jgi:hypothetical protein